MRIDLQRLAGSVNRLLTDAFPPSPNGRILTVAGGAENEYGDREGAATGALLVWVILSRPRKETLEARSVGGATGGIVEFTARGAPRPPRAGDVLEGEGISYRVTEATPDSPAGNYVDGVAERMHP